MVTNAVNESRDTYSMIAYSYSQHNVANKAKYDGMEISNNSYRYKTMTIKNMPTKGYIDKIIANAVSNIKKGEKVSENLKVLHIFSNIVGENPLKLEHKVFA